LEQIVTPEHLPLLNALYCWCRRELIDKIIFEECQFSARELSLWHGPRIAPEDTLRREYDDGWRDGPQFGMLRNAWEAAEHDFRMRVERRALFLQGIVLSDDLMAVPSPIPGGFATAMHFDFHRNTLILQKRKYVSIVVSQTPFATPANLTPPAPQTTSVPPSIKDYSDEQILALLNQHIDRVVSSPEPKMMARIKDVLQPIIMRRLQFRAERGELKETLSAEAKELQRWIGEVASWHPVPKPKTIENNIRYEYGRLMPRSKAMISR